MIELIGLTKKFKDFTAVDDLTLTINTGEFFGLLGPNGAGKTTTISMLSTVLLPTAGSIYIDGVLLSRRAREQKRKISVITQEYSMRQDMSVWEVMEYQGRLYRMNSSLRKQKIQEMLELVDLWEYRNRRVRQLSGGMKRRLMIGRGLMVEPEIMLLDEPTAGMDAIARQKMWQFLKKINKGNLTILLTTHYMEEAQALCDRVAIINKGKLEVTDTPKALIEKLGEYCVTEEDAVNKFFKDRTQAIEYLTKRGDKAAFRMTGLEDVFISIMEDIENRK